MTQSDYFIRCSTYWVIRLGCVALVALACGALTAPGEVDASGALTAPGEVDASVVMTAPGEGGATWVGVIPSGSSCPREEDKVVFRLDDEDDLNCNYSTGYTGGIESDRNTRLVFCRVDGNQLYPLSTDMTDSSGHYAVLQLGDNCPNGSHPFQRWFDNENTSNANFSEGELGPNTSDDETKLYFCLFAGGDATMAAFPPTFSGSEQFDYGVFASTDLRVNGRTGVFRTSHESTDQNSINPDYKSYAAELISNEEYATTFLVHEVVSSDPLDASAPPDTFPNICSAEEAMALLDCVLNNCPNPTGTLTQECVDACEQNFMAVSEGCQTCLRINCRESLFTVAARCVA